MCACVWQPPEVLKISKELDAGICVTQCKNDSIGFCIIVKWWYDFSPLWLLQAIYSSRKNNLLTANYFQTKHWMSISSTTKITTSMKYCCQSYTAFVSKALANAWYKCRSLLTYVPGTNTILLLWLGFTIKCTWLWRGNPLVVIDAFMCQQSFDALAWGILN